MIIPKRWRLRSALLALAAIALGGAGVWLAHPSGSADAPALLKSAIAYCASDMNVTPNQVEQMTFIQVHSADGTLMVDNQGPQVWLDYWIKDKAGNDTGVAIRYYAGTEDKNRCSFGIVTPGNHPEVAAAIARYQIGKRTYTGDGKRFCYSSLPPTTSRYGTDGDNTVTIVCSA